MGDNISTVGITSVLWRANISTVEGFSTVEGYLQYCGRITAVLVGDSFSTVEVVQYSGGIASVQWGIASVLWGIASVLWRLFSKVEG